MSVFFHWVVHSSNIGGETAVARQHEKEHQGGRCARSSQVHHSCSCFLRMVAWGVRLLGAGAVIRRFANGFNPVLPAARPTVSSKIGFSFTPGLMHRFSLPKISSVCQMRRLSDHVLQVSRAERHVCMYVCTFALFHRRTLVPVSPWCRQMPGARRVPGG